MKKIFISLASIFCLHVSANAQVSKHTLDSIDVVYQKCLDKGTHMVACTATYYTVMDSLLNVIYTATRKRLDSTGKNNLKADQLKWLKQRDLFFAGKEQEFDTKTKSGEWGKDDRMIINDDKALYVKKRILYLMRLY